MADSPSTQFQRRYGLPEIVASLAALYPDDHPFLSADERNAIAHVLTSALLTMRFSAEEAKHVGDIREDNTTAGFYYLRQDNELLGTYMDLYNNRVGREIGQYAIENGLTEAEARRLVEDALATGQLAVWTDHTNIRLPTIGLEPFGGGYLDTPAQRLVRHFFPNDDSNFAGWAREYEEVTDIWEPVVRNYWPEWTAQEVQAALSTAGFDRGRRRWTLGTIIPCWAHPVSGGERDIGYWSGRSPHDGGAWPA